MKSISVHFISKSSRRSNYVGLINDYELPSDLSGYEQLPTDCLYHPVQEDPTLQPAVEADTIKAIYNVEMDFPLSSQDWNIQYFSTSGWPNSQKVNSCEDLQNPQYLRRAEYLTRNQPYSPGS